MTATNMWSPQIMGIDQATFFTTVPLISAAIVLVALTITVAIKKKKLSSR
jgi:hypothetical protein